MKFKTITLITLLAGVFSHAQNLPENPEPGKCYVKCITKDEFKEVEERIEISPEHNILEVVPATYKTVEERVMVKEASKKLIYVPAVYETVEVDYVKKDARTDLEVLPASFGKKTEKLEVYPKVARWEYKHMENCTSDDKEDCVTACFVEYPPQFQELGVTTLVTDARTRDVSVDGVKSVYAKKVVKQPARVNEVEIPAEYATIKKQVLETPATTKKVTIPAKYEVVKRTELVKKGGVTVWEEVDCDYLTPTILPIFYDYDSARLTQESKRIIDERLMPVLEGKLVKVKIMSHTDSRGDDAYNMSLSQQRAQSVVNYLVSKGIARNRLQAEGYGETKLRNRCSNGIECSDAQHRENRRTEFIVLQ